MRVVIGWACMTLAVAATTALLPGVNIDGGVGTYMWVGALFSMVNMVFLLLRVISPPFITVTLGVLSLVINALLVLLVDWLSASLHVNGFWVAMFAAFLISGLNFTLWVLFFPDLIDAEQPTVTKR